MKAIIVYYHIMISIPLTICLLDLSKKYHFNYRSNYLACHSFNIEPYLVRIIQEPRRAHLIRYMYLHLQGRIQDFKLGGHTSNFWGILCEKSRFYAKKLYFFQLRRETRTFLGYFVWKITILRQKNHIFSNCGGRRENCWGISCEKSRFYAKKSYFFQF